jgi:hypothetical protein
MFVHVNLYDIKHRFTTHLITAMKYKNTKKSDQTGISCPCFYGDVINKAKKWKFNTYKLIKPLKTLVRKLYCSKYSWLFVNKNVDD